MGDSISRVQISVEPYQEGQVEFRCLNEFSVYRDSDYRPLDENAFHAMLTYELRRAERSKKPFVLMLVDTNLEEGAASNILWQVAQVLLSTNRETDLTGWYKRNLILGVIFTLINGAGETTIAETLRTKVESALVKNLGALVADKVSISLHFFPENS